MERPGNPRLVQDVMGHEDLDTTSKYTHPKVRAIKEVIDLRNSETAAVRAARKESQAAKDIDELNRMYKLGDAKL
jgi:hypothetical protein